MSILSKGTVEVYICCPFVEKAFVAPSYSNHCWTTAEFKTSECGTGGLKMYTRSWRVAHTHGRVTIGDTNNMQERWEDSGIIMGSLCGSIQVSGQIDADANRSMDIISRVYLVHQSVPRYKRAACVTVGSPLKVTLTS